MVFVLHVEVFQLEVFFSVAVVVGNSVGIGSSSSADIQLLQYVKEFGHHDVTYAFKKSLAAARSTNARQKGVRAEAKNPVRREAKAYREK